MPLTGRRHYLDTLAGQIGWQTTPAHMAPTHRRPFSCVLLRGLVGGLRLDRSGNRRLKGQHPLLDHRHALLAAPPEQPMRQQLDPLA